MARELRKMGEERALVLYKVHLQLSAFLLPAIFSSCRCCQLFPAVYIVDLDWWCFYDSVRFANLVAEHAACAVACTYFLQPF